MAGQEHGQFITVISIRIESFLAFSEILKMVNISDNVRLLNSTLSFILDTFSELPLTLFTG